MTHRKVSHVLLAAIVLAVSTSALPVPFSPLGMMGLGYGGMLGGLGAGNIGASYSKSGATYAGADHGPMVAAPLQSPTSLSGTSRVFNSANAMVSGLNVIIQPQESAMTELNHGMMAGGLYGGGAALGGGMYGGGAGMLGGVYGTGMFGASHGLMGALGGMYGMDGHSSQLEVTIEILEPTSFVPATALIVFTEPAVSSGAIPCPRGPILTQPHSDMGAGFLGSGNMLQGYGFGLGPLGGMGMGPSDSDFGVTAEVNLQAGVNTFQIQGLGQFNDIKQLAGRGLSMCEDVQIGMNGRPMCVGVVFGCVKLGYTMEPEVLMSPP